MESSPVKLSGAWQWPHHNVGAGRGADKQLAAYRAKTTANAVANDRTADTLRDDEPKTGGRRITRARKVDDGMWGRQASTGANSGTEIRTTEHSVGLSEHSETCELHHRRVLNRQARCALAATGYAESSVRPLRRRAPRMARPARVRIRRRKPCTLARRRLFGWKVLLLIVNSSKAQLVGRKRRGCPKAEVN